MSVAALSRPTRRRVITPFSPEAVMGELLAVDTGLSSGAWTANLAEYVPITLSQPTVVGAFFWENGGTVGGSTEVCVYDPAATTKLATSTATTNAGTSAIQSVDITDVTLGPGRYWLSIGSDSGTQTYNRANAVSQYLNAMGIYQQTSAWSSGLPAPPTFAAPSVGALPMFGFVVGGAVI